MNFDVEREKIIEEILSVENYDCVDPELMEKINSSDEYRKLFEDAKKLSYMARESVPSPVKAGVSLHDALVSRIREGDTAPRYINVSKRYPFATAACLLIVFAIVLVARSGIGNKFANKSFDSAVENEAAVEDFEFVTADLYSAQKDFAETETAFDGKVMLSKNKNSSSSGGSARAEENGVSNKYAVDTSIGNGEVYNTNSALFDDAEAPESDTEYRENVHFDSSSDVKVTMPSYGMGGASLNAAIVEKQESEDLKTQKLQETSSLSQKVVQALERVGKLGADVNAIGEKEILALGEALYLEWLSSILDSESFASLYTLEGFEEYCNSRA